MDRTTEGMAMSTAARRTAMRNYMAKTWWLMLLRGVLAVIFGLLAYAMPQVTLASLVLLFGAFALADGVLSLWAVMQGKVQGDNRWWIGLQGVAGVALGLLTLFMPGATTMGLLYVIAAWMLVIGVFTIVAAIKLRAEIEGEVWLGLAGLLSVAFGLYMMVAPGAGALALIWVIAGYAIIFGVAMIVFSLRVRNKQIPDEVVDKFVAVRDDFETARKRMAEGEAQSAARDVVAATPQPASEPPKP